MSNISSANLAVPVRAEDNRRKAFEYVLLILIGGYLLIDTFNGMLVKTFGLPSVLSAAYKQGILLLVLIYAFQFERKRFIQSLMCLILIFVWAICRFFLVDDVAFLYAFQEAIKVAYLFILVIVLSKMTVLQEKTVKAVLWFSLIVLILNIISTIAGFGYKTYGEFGAKGFFYAGNSISGVIVICASYLLTKAFKRSLLNFFVLILFLSAVSLIIGTKSGFLGVSFVALLVMLIHFDTRTLLSGVLMVFAIAIGVYVFYQAILDSGMYHRIAFFYDVGGLQTVLFSGRDVKLDIIMPALVNADFSEFLFGANMHELTKTGVTRVEFDWVDMHINFGFLLSAGVYLGYLFIFLRLMLAPKNDLVISALIAFIVLIFISAIAGHVMYNGMVTPLWAFLIASALTTEVKSKQSIVHA